MKKYKIGLIGLGHVANTHVRAIEEMENAEVLAVCDRDKDRVSEFSQKYNIPKVYLEFDELLKDEDIDIINILTPSGTHAELAKKAAAYGKHVIVEKPIDVSIEKSIDMIACCREKGAKLSVISQHRFDASTEALREALDKGKLGKVILVDVKIKCNRNQAYYDKDKWRGTKKLDGGGVILNQGIHMIDLMLHLFGEVEELSAMIDTVAHEGIEVEDTAVAMLKFNRGIYGTISATTGIFPNMALSLEVNGTDGTIKIEDDKLIYAELKDRDFQREIIERCSGFNKKLHKHVAHKKQMENFIYSIENGLAPISSGEEGLRALELVKRIYRVAGEKEE